MKCTVRDQALGYLVLGLNPVTKAADLREWRAATQREGAQRTESDRPRYLGTLSVIRCLRRSVAFSHPTCSMTCCNCFFSISKV